MAHVCMVIEGAYPYITGGVSAWCHLLIQAIPEVEFSLLVILPSSYREKEYKYTLPKNVIAVHEIWLDVEYVPEKKIPPTKKEMEAFFSHIKSFHTSMKLKNYKYFQIISGLFSQTGPAFSIQELVKSKDAVKALFDQYGNAQRTGSFMKYFWTWTSTHVPIFRIINAKLPRADLYHAVSTGYAGLVSALAAHRYNIPYVLTEHGIYAMEREDELAAAEYVSDGQRQLWINFFHSLCRISYSIADKIITLFRGNLIIEVANNANVDRIEIIPNGVHLELYNSIPRKVSDKCVHVAFVGRVVPIKDVKTFIKAAGIVRDTVESEKADEPKLPDIRFSIIGPTDEDEEYYNECVALATELKLGNTLEFAGKKNMIEEYSIVDILVLTSVREAQPLVLLEGMGAGIPCISTDVGACSGMLEDVGFITRCAAPQETAEAILRLYRNKELRATLGIKGKERVKSQYNIDDVTSRYKAIYLNISEEWKKKKLENYGRNRISASSSG